MTCDGDPLNYGCSFIGDSTDGTYASYSCASKNVTTISETPAPTTPTAQKSVARTCPPGTPAGELCYTPLEPLPGDINESGAPGSFGSLLNGVFRILISLGGLVAVLALVIGGITYMVSDIADKKDQAKKRISGALWGLLILISSVLILQTINPQLLNFNFGPFGTAEPVSTNTTNATNNTSGNSGNSVPNTTTPYSITIRANDPYFNTLLQSYKDKCGGKIIDLGSQVSGDGLTYNSFKCG